ncbi:MAG TPA: glycosyltransferase [Acidimicrobiales bacterium]|nr:glycosyltransferase [Acidimicrobiales bacterium]
MAPSGPPLLVDDAGPQARRPRPHPGPRHDGPGTGTDAPGPAVALRSRAPEAAPTPAPATPAPPFRPRAAAIIPARDEAPTIGAVVYAASDAALVDEVVVVDNASTDGSAAVAAAHGARVVHEPSPGKGQALRTGVAATDAPVVVFLDADLVGLRPQHVDRLVATVASGEAAMACGLFDRGPLANRVFLHHLPVLTGQRALPRALFERLELADVRGYRVEAALNSLVGRADLPRSDEVLPGLWHRTKEEKAATPAVGSVRKVGMLACACWSYLRCAVVGRPGPVGGVRLQSAGGVQGSSRGAS